MTSRQREWQRERAARGECIICGVYAERGVYCEKHRRKRLARLAENRQREPGAVVYRCGACGEYGHNRRACEAASNAVKKSGRACGNCGEQGHNRRTCTANTSDTELE
jgi:hypothetical protein